MVIILLTLNCQYTIFLIDEFRSPKQDKGSLSLSLSVFFKLLFSDEKIAVMDASMELKETEHVEQVDEVQRGRIIQVFFVLDSLLNATGS